MPATVDLSQMKLSLMQMAQVPGKHGPDIVNKSAMKIAIGAKGAQGLVQLTQKATVARIERDLKRNKLGVKLATKWLKDQGQPINRHSIAGAYQRIRNSRVKSRAYIAAAWSWAAADMAKKVPGQKFTRLTQRGVQKNAEGSASDSYAQAATGSKLTAGMFSTARGAASVCTDQVVQIAVDNATVDNNKYLRKKFGAAIDDAIAGTNKASSIADT